MNPCLFKFYFHSFKQDILNSVFSCSHWTWVNTSPSWAWSKLIFKPRRISLCRLHAFILQTWSTTSFSRQNLSFALSHARWVSPTSSTLAVGRLYFIHHLLCSKHCGSAGASHPVQFQHSHPTTTSCALPHTAQKQGVTVVKLQKPLRT